MQRQAVCIHYIADRPFINYKLSYDIYCLENCNIRQFQPEKFMNKTGHMY